MNHNLIITYDLFKGGSALNQGKNYAAMEAAVKTLGLAVKVNFTVWIVSSQLDSGAALAQLRAAADGNDKIFVADATADTCTWTPNYPAADADRIRAVWEGKASAAAGLGLFGARPSVLAAGGLGLLNMR